MVPWYTFLSIIFIFSFSFLPITAEGNEFIKGNNNQRTGVSSYKGSKSNTLRWRYSTGRYIFSSPVVDPKNIVYFGSGDNYIYAVNVNTGAEKWRYQTGDEVHSSPTLSLKTNILFIGSNDWYMYALNASTGTLLWRYQTQYTILSSPLLDDTKNVVYFGSNNQLYALDSEKGTLLWSYETLGNLYANTPSLSSDSSTLYITSYVSSSETYLYSLAVSVQSVSLNYRISIENIGTSSVSLYNDTLFVTSYYGKLSAINASTGIVKWSYSVNAEGQHSAPSISTRGIVYVGFRNGFIFAFRHDTGDVVWSASIGSVIEAPITIDIDNTLYVGDSASNMFYSIDGANGNILWTYSSSTIRTPGSMATIAKDGIVVVGSYDGYLYAFLDIHIPSLPLFPNAVNPPSDQILDTYTWVCETNYYGPSMTWTWDSISLTWISSGGPLNCQRCPDNTYGLGGTTCMSVSCPLGKTLTTDGCVSIGPREGLVFEYTGDYMSATELQSVFPTIHNPYGIVYVPDRYNQSNRAVHLRTGSSLSVPMTAKPSLPTGSQSRTFSAWIKGPLSSSTGSIVSYGGWISSAAAPSPCTISTAIGIQGSCDTAGDGGPASSAAICNPSGIAVGRDGALYIAEYSNRNIRRVDPVTGIVTSVVSGFGEHNAYLSGVAVDSNNTVYFSVSNQYALYKRTTDGAISRIAGSGQYGNDGDGGPALSAKLFNPTAIAVDSKGYIYFASDNSSWKGDSYIRRVRPDGIIERWAGRGKGASCYYYSIPYQVCDDEANLRNGGSALNISLLFIEQIAFDPDDNLYISDLGLPLWRISPDQKAYYLQTKTSTGAYGRIELTRGVALDAQGNMVLNYLATVTKDSSSDSILYNLEGVYYTSLVNILDGTTRRIAGDGTWTYKDTSDPFGTGFAYHNNVAVAPDGAIYIVDFSSSVVRKLDASCAGTDPRNGRSGLSIRSHLPNTTTTDTTTGVPYLHDISGPLASLPVPLAYIDDDKWHHVAVTYDGSARRVYIDGKKRIAVPTFLMNTSSTGDLIIGNAPLGFEEEWLNGTVDDIRIYNRALTDSEITLLYRPGLPSFPNAVNPPSDQILDTYTWVCETNYYGPSMTWTWDSISLTWISSGGPINCLMVTPTATPSANTTATPSFNYSNPASGSSSPAVTATRSAISTGVGSTSKTTSTRTPSPSASPFPSLKVSFGLYNINVTTLIEPDGISNMETVLYQLAGTGVLSTRILSVCTFTPRTCPYDITTKASRLLLVVDRTKDHHDDKNNHPDTSTSTTTSSAIRNGVPYVQRVVPSTYVTIESEFIYTTPSLRDSSLSSIQSSTSNFSSSFISLLQQQDPYRFSSAQFTSLLSITTGGTQSGGGGGNVPNGDTNLGSASAGSFNLESFIIAAFVIIILLLVIVIIIGVLLLTRKNFSNNNKIYPTDSDSVHQRHGTSSSSTSTATTNRDVLNGTDRTVIQNNTSTKENKSIDEPEPEAITTVYRIEFY